MDLLNREPNLGIVGPGELGGGSGASSAPVHIPAVVDNLSGVITMGHSYGGMIITGVADKAPERLPQAIMNAGRD